MATPDAEVARLDVARLDGALLDAVRSVRWPARRPAPAGAPGAHLARALGASAELTEWRAYRQGDDPRRIDWKLLARTDRASIRLSHDRAQLPTTLLVDASASMAYPETTREKWAHARHVAIGLAAAAHAGGDPIGLVVASEAGPGARRLPPRTRRGTVRELARLLAEIEPAGQAPLAPLLAELRVAPRVAIVSDFLGDADALLGVAAACVAAGREVHAVHVVHADELEPPPGERAVADPERPELRRALGESTREGYRRAFAEWRERLAHDWRAAGAYYALVPTTEPAAHAVRRIASPRAIATP